MKKHIKLILVLSITLSIYGCKGTINAPSFTPPLIEIGGDTLNVNLNWTEDENILVVADIKSEAGLEKIYLKIIVDYETLTYTSIKEFENSKNYNLSETLTFKEGYEGVIIEAVDISGQSSEKQLYFKITEKFDAPIINFVNDSLVYNILKKDEIPRTEFSIHSEAGLKKIEMLLKTNDSYTTFQAPVELMKYLSTIARCLTLYRSQFAPIYKLMAQQAVGLREKSRIGSMTLASSENVY